MDDSLANNLEVERCGASRRIGGDRYLRLLARTIAEPGAERSAWHARLVGDRRDLRCLRLRAPRAQMAHVRECAATLRAGRSLMAWDMFGSPSSGTTAVAVGADDLATVTVKTPTASIPGRVVSGRLALVVLDRYVPRSALAVEVRHTDGTVELHDEAKLRTVSVGDPTTNEIWLATTLTTPDETAPRCTLVSRGETPWEGGACAAGGHVPFYFRISLTPRAASIAPELERTVVAGAADRSVATVVVTAAPGERQLTLAPRGGAFLAIYSREIAPDSFTVVVRFKDGTSETYVGREQANNAR